MAALALVRTNLSQTKRSKLWTVYEMGMRYEHLKREQVLYGDRSENVPNPKYLRKEGSHHVRPRPYH